LLQTYRQYPKTTAPGRFRARVLGMSLSELLVVVAISAVLATIAVPGYRVYLLRSHRVEATAALLQLSAAQEQFYLQHNTYTDELTTAAPGGLGLQGVTQNGFYEIAVDSADAAGFQATARARGGQADDTHCAAFTLDEAGARTARNRNEAAVRDCWSR
jgi:type IV pilus assembly protein PilE